MDAVAKYLTGVCTIYLSIYIYIVTYTNSKVAGAHANAHIYTCVHLRMYTYTCVSAFADTCREEWLLNPLQVRDCFPEMKIEPDGAIFSMYGFSIKIDVPGRADNLYHSALIVDAYREHAENQLAVYCSMTKQLGAYFIFF